MIFASEVQLLNAPFVIMLTLLGIVMLVKEVHPLKAPLIETMSLEIIVFLHPQINVFDAVSIIALQLFLES